MNKVKEIASPLLLSSSPLVINKLMKSNRVSISDMFETPRVIEVDEEKKSAVMSKKTRLKKIVDDSDSDQDNDDATDYCEIISSDDEANDKAKVVKVANTPALSRSKNEEDKLNNNFKPSYQGKDKQKKSMKEEADSAEVELIFVKEAEKKEEIVHCDGDQTTKRKRTMELVRLNQMYEKEIEECPNLAHLTEELMYYMVLRDVNHLIDIFSGCIKCWRHDEFMKKTKMASNILYENTALCNFTQTQYMSAFKGLEKIFCKKHRRYEDYVVKVLLPESLIRICARVYGCSRDEAEEFLRIAHSKSSLKTEFPNGSTKTAT